MWRKNDGEKVINFRNADQVFLYECELKGQISDGYWENASPQDHYEVMCDAKAKVDEDNLGRNFTPLRRYNFAAPDLVNVVGDRMITFVQTKRVFPDLDFDDHWDWCLEDGAEDLRRLSESLPDRKYWSEKIEKMEKFFGMSLEEAEKKIKANPYSRKNLMRDLKDMSRIVNTLSSK